MGSVVSQLLWALDRHVWSDNYRHNLVSPEELSLARVGKPDSLVHSHRFTLQRLNRRIEALEQEGRGDEKTLGAGRAGGIPNSLNVRRGFRYMI